MDYNLLLIGASFITSFILTFIAIPSVLEVAYKKKLFDIPDERKVHKQEIPSLGGVGIFIGVIIAYSLWASPIAYASYSYKFIITSYLILFFMSLKDDLVIMPTRQKLVIQLIVTCLLVFGGVRILSLHGLLGIEELPYWVSVFCSIIFIIGVMNAFNLIDGIDGLAGGLGGINCLTFGTLMFLYKEYDFAILAFAVGGALLAFLYFNFNKYPNKIFMGDTGSLLIGMTIVVLAVSFINTPNRSDTQLDIVSPPLMVFGILLIPIFDTLRVMALRISQGRSPFSPDKNHIHHEFLAAGASHKMASISLYIINVLLVLTVILFRDSGALLLGVLILFVGSACTQILIFLRYQKRDKTVDDLTVKLNQLKKENQFLK